MFGQMGSSPRVVSVRLFVVTAKKREVADSLRKHPREAEPKVCFLISATCTRGGYRLGGDNVGHCNEMGMDASVCRAPLITGRLV